MDRGAIHMPAEVPGLSSLAWKRISGYSWLG